MQGHVRVVPTPVPGRDSWVETKSCSRLTSQFRCSSCPSHASVPALTAIATPVHLQSHYCLHNCLTDSTAVWPLVAAKRQEHAS